MLLFQHTALEGPSSVVHVSQVGPVKDELPRALETFSWSQDLAHFQGFRGFPKPLLSWSSVEIA